MNKNAIQRYAVWARTEMIAQVSQRAYQYEITPEGYGDFNAVSISGRLLSDSERKQRQGVIRQIQAKGYTQAMEEVAYTWFNRFIALRFMEVNNYLPSHIRVFTDSSGDFKPEILTQALHLNLPNLDMDKVARLIDENQTEDLYRYLLLTQCNALNSALPRMFESLGGYTELLLPNNILRQDGVIGRMVSDIPEGDWTYQVQIIGWLYQYYNSDLKDETFALLKKNVKITKERLPSATQLFTPDWIVRYMVENSLGRLWVEGHPNEELKLGWKYYLDEANQQPAVEAQIEAMREMYRTLQPQDIKLIDPCMGSGHILVYSFDVLIQIYKAAGFNERDAAQSIVKNNLYGLDIDERAAQLSYFAIMMKARQYDRRFLARNIQPNVYAIKDSNMLPGASLKELSGLELPEEDKKTLRYLIETFRDAKEYGSILNIEGRNYIKLKQDWAKLIATKNDCLSLFSFSAYDELVSSLIEQAITLSFKYNVVVTNPPYMASGGMNSKLFKYVKDNYDWGRNDLYTVFILKCRDLCCDAGFLGMITQIGWLSLTRSFQLRSAIYSTMTYCNLLHLGSRVFDDLNGEVVKSAAFVLLNKNFPEYRSVYVKLDGLNSVSEKISFIHRKEKTFLASITETKSIEGYPLSYWLPRSMLPLFDNSTVASRFICRAGMQTGNNEMFLRYWFEPSCTKVDHFCPGTKWFSYNKGGAQRKWYGNNDLVVNWENNGFDIKAEKKRRLELGEIEKKNSECWNSEFYFVEGATWSSIASGTPMFRIASESSIFDIKGPTCFAKKGITHDELIQILGYLNSPIVGELLAVLSPTLDCNPGTVSKLPYIPQLDNSKINTLVENCISLSQADWDSFETSWDFHSHPLVKDVLTVQAAFVQWHKECEDRFTSLRFNEEELNRLFIYIYGLQDELVPEVEDKDVTVRRADLGRDIRSLISYAVGCMFGRYSLDTPGLAYAGGEWDSSKYCSFIPDEDNIIPICDDEYFEDDITGLFVKWVMVVFGAETLEENLKFIADALGGKGTPREVIRNYFLNGFYADHLKVYQKRPIYWLFDSGKKNGFKALIYIHRYRSDLLACMRTDYVHEQQERYRTQLRHIGDAMGSASASERVRLAKQQKKLQEQALELQKYEEKIHHLADQNIKIDLDDGVVHNYEIFSEVLAKR